MRAEIDFLADQAKREIHELTLQACRELGCLEEYQVLMTLDFHATHLPIDQFIRRFGYGPK